MGKVSDNRIKFSKSSLRAIERRVDRGEFTKEFYMYDIDMCGFTCRALFFGYGFHFLQRLMIYRYDKLSGQHCMDLLFSVRRNIFRKPRRLGGGSSLNQLVLPIWFRDYR